MHCGSFRLTSYSSKSIWHRFTLIYVTFRVCICFLINMAVHLVFSCLLFLDSPCTPSQVRDAWTSISVHGELTRTIAQRISVSLQSVAGDYLCIMTITYLENRKTVLKRKPEETVLKWSGEETVLKWRTGYVLYPGSFRW